MSATATVEVLTAEVRVLMVGSRQVTLSVYNQLDEVPHSGVEPFGRVNPKDAERGRIYVVGRDRETGVLVRSKAPHWNEVMKVGEYARPACAMRTEAIATVDTFADVDEDGLRDAIRRAAVVIGRLIASGLLEEFTSRNLLTDAVRSGLKTQAAIWVSQTVEAARESDAASADGELERQAMDLIGAYSNARSRAVSRAALFGAEWSALPLIVLAGLR
jgi:hypothetical protein